MSARKQRPGEGPNDLAEAPFLDDAERAESAWLLAREHDPSAPAPSPKIASDYAEIEDLLGNLPLGPPDESWHDEVLRTVASPPSPSRSWRRRAITRWATGGALVAAAAVAVLLLRPRPRTDELEIAILHTSATRSDFQDVVVGDRLVIKARPNGAGDLRVFRSGGTLVARCPDGPGCGASTQGEYALEITLDAPVRYQVILVVGMVTAPLGGTMSAYLDAARAVNARIIMHQPIDVH
jgi:hypothetical protein